MVYQLTNAIMHILLKTIKRLYKYYKNVIRESRQVGNILERVHTLFINEHISKTNRQNLI